MGRVTTFPGPQENEANPQHQLPFLSKNEIPMGTQARFSQSMKTSPLNPLFQVWVKLELLFLGHSCTSPLLLGLFDACIFGAAAWKMPEKWVNLWILSLTGGWDLSWSVPGGITVLPWEFMEYCLIPQTLSLGRIEFQLQFQAALLKIPLCLSTLKILIRNQS